MSCQIDPKKSQIIRENHFLTLVAANKEGKPIGKAAASILKTDKPFIWLHDLSVAPQCRDKGVGTQILNQLAQVGKDKKAELIYAYPASPADEKHPIDQEKIENFYKKNDFKPCIAPKKVFTVTNEGLENKGGVCLKL